MTTEPIIRFLLEIEKFKTCERTCHTSNLERPESDAEHSWHLAVFLMLQEDRLQNLDFDKVLKLALIHDLPELYSGDLNPYRDDNSGKEKAEKKAAEKLFAMLPDPLGQNLAALFSEYIEQQTPEAKVVKAADKLLPLVQNIQTSAGYSSYRKLGVTYDEVRDYMDPFCASGVLADYYEELLSRAQTNNVFADSKNSVFGDYASGPTRS